MRAKLPTPDWKRESVFFVMSAVRESAPQRVSFGLLASALSVFVARHKAEQFTRAAIELLDRMRAIDIDREGLIAPATLRTGLCIPPVHRGLFLIARSSL